MARLIRYVGPHKEAMERDIRFEKGQTLIIDDSEADEILSAPGFEEVNSAPRPALTLDEAPSEDPAEAATEDFSGVLPKPKAPAKKLPGKKG